MYKFFYVLLIIGIGLTLFRVMAQVDAFPSFPGDYLFDQYSTLSILILIAGVIGTAVLRPSKGKD